MSDYGFLYIIDTSYHTDRQAYEVTIGYMAKDEEVSGRFITINVLVNIPNHKNEKNTVKELAFNKARKVLEMASQADAEEE
jgi:hypothetical protein